jgi:Protein of unknown function (DUF1549)/Protein of unknown function (DUF1553)
LNESYDPKMDFEPDDPLLDSLLDEVLAGRTPPDLTARILQAYAARQYGDQAPEPPPVLAGVPMVFEPAAANPQVQARAKSSGRQRQPRSWSTALTIGVAAAVIGLCITVGLVAVVRTGSQQIARDEKAPQPSPAPIQRNIATRPSKPEPELDRVRMPAAPTPAPTTPQIVQQTPVELAPTLPPEPKVTPKQQPATESAIAAAPLPRKERNLTPSPDAQIVSFVNAELSRVWKDAGVKPTPVATDAEWCQRLFVRVLGRVPTADEQKSLAADNAKTRREKLVERLLTQPSYIEEFAHNWAAVLTKVFLGRGSARGSSSGNRDELEGYFFAALYHGTRYDEIAQGLLTATGAAKPGDEVRYSPATNFLLDGMDSRDSNNIVPTARVARVMLGHQLQCAQCHDHPTQGWTQEQFWGLAACFRQLFAHRVGDTVRLVRLDWRANGTETIFETPDGLMKAIGPRFIDGTVIPVGTDIDPRLELAHLIVDSDDFAKAAVNRIWAQLFDYGFTRPVDDPGPQASPVASAVLDRLATEFAAHDFDIKRVIRWAVLSEPFSRSSKLTDLASKDMPEEGEAALFSRFYARPIQAPAVMGALVEANRIRTIASGRSDVESARIAWLANQTPASKGGKNAAPVAGPSVLMPGSDPQHRSVSGDPTGLVKKLAGSDLALDKQVEHLFLAALARPPLPREQQVALQLLRNAQGNQAAALEDIWWALQNSSECVLDR